ncbi:MAG: hypothetical protein PVI06_07815 [Desulfobacterales bacterium]
MDKFATIAPPVARLYGLAGTPIKTNIQILPKEKYPFRIVEAKAKDGQNIRFRLQEQNSSQTVKYLLTIENKKKEKGRYYDVVYLKTDSKLVPQLRITVYGNINVAKVKSDT